MPIWRASASPVDWMLANTSADSTRMGVAGISYGSGISLLGAAFDPRIRAVAAMSCWTDLLYSLLANQTRHQQAAGLLQLAADLTGRPSPELQQVLSDYFGNRNLSGLAAFAQVRSAATYVDRLNANRPAILMANAYGDSLFAPNQLTDFFARLTVPKRLELRPGDHAIPELTGLLGVPNDAWINVHRWFDQYLRGWSSTIAAGLDTPANGGAVLLTNGAEALTGVLPTAWIPGISRANAGIWQSDWLTSDRRLRGAPRLRLTVTPGSSGQTTIIAYLYDTDWAGNGRLVTHVAVTLRGAVAGQAYTVDTDFVATAYDVPSGHRLSLVIDTVDPLYADSAAPFTSVRFSSPSANPSYVSLPLK